MSLPWHRKSVGEKKRISLHLHGNLGQSARFLLRLQLQHPGIHPGTNALLQMCQRTLRGTRSSSTEEDPAREPWLRQGRGAPGLLHLWPTARATRKVSPAESSPLPDMPYSKTLLWQSAATRQVSRRPTPRGSKYPIVIYSPKS